MNIPLWARRSALAAGLMMGSVGAAHAAFDVILQHTGPGNGVVTDTLTYQVKLDNSDPGRTDTATGVVLSYSYNPDMVSLSGTPTFANGSGSCTDNGTGTITCNVANIPHGTNNLTIDFKFDVHGTGFTGTSVAFNPVAKLTAGGGSDTSNDEEQVNTTIAPGTDLGVTLTQTAPTVANPNQLSSGSVWTHDVVVVNNGPLATTNAKVTIVPSAVGSVWVTSSLPSGCAVDGANVPGANLICTIPGSFASTATTTFSGIQAQVVAAAGSSQTATASIASDLPDNKSINNSQASDISVTPGTDLELKLSTSGGTVLAGSPRTVTVTPTYHGAVPDTPTFTITIPSTLSVNTSTPPTSPGWGTCAWSGTTTLTCSGWDSTGKVAGASQAMGQVSFNVTGPTGTHEITGVISSSSTEPAPDTLHPNNDSVNVVFSEPTSNVAISKTGPAAPHNKFTTGATVTYTVTLTASGNVNYWGDLAWTENAPAGLTVTEITGPTGWSCTVSGCSRTYTEAAPLATGSTVTFTVTATVTEASGGSLVNQACRAAFTHPLGVSQGESCDNAGAITGNPDSGNTDLAVTKTAPTAAANIKAGDWLEYKIELVNNGPKAASNAKVTDSLTNLWVVPGSPANDGSFQITAIPAGWACTAGGALVANDYRNSASLNLECTTPTFNTCTAGTNCPVLEFKVRPLGSNDNGNNRNRNNTAVISSVTQELNFSNNTSSTGNVAVQAKTDFTIAKAVSNGWDSAAEGGKTGTELQYTITVTNAGISGANNVIVSDVLPENVTYLGIQGSDLPTCTGLAANDVTTSASKTLTCTWSSFERTADRSFIVRIRPNHEWQGLELSNDVYVNVEPGTTTALATTTEETNYGNNHAQAKAKAGEADIDLQVNKRDTVDPVNVGAETEYEVIITNNGPSVATAATIYDYLPVKGFSWVGNVRFFETDGTSRGTEITGTGPTCSVTPVADALGAKGEDKTNPDKLNWLWPMNETGQSTPNPNYVNGKWDSRIADADIICNVGNMLPGTKVMLVYTMKAEERGVYMNHSIVRAKEHIDRKDDGFTDSVWNNDAIQHRTTVRSVPNVDLSKEVSETPVNLMQPFSYTITVTNNSAVEQLYAPQVRDSLPANMELTGVPTMAGSLTGGDFACFTPPTAPDVPPAVGASVAAGDTAFVCKLGEGVAAGSSVVITVPVRVTAGSPVTLTNKASLHLDTDLEFDSGEPDPVKEDDVDVEVVVSSLSGYVYHDVNNDGVKDAGESPIAGVTVTLTGTDDYGNPVTRTTTTDVNGYYRFDNLVPGTYTVTETHPTGWVDGKDTVGKFGSDPGQGTAGDDVIRSIVLPAKTHGVEYNFGELKDLTDPSGAQVASISGYVYHDKNNDGSRDTGEEAIEGVVITLKGENGDERTTTTDANGYYEFKNLEPDVQYTLTETQPEGWADGKDTVGTEHTSVTATNDEFVVTTVSGKDGENWNFGERKINPAPVPVDNPLALLALILGMGWIARRFHMRKHA